MSKCYVLYNPLAGGGGARECAESISVVYSGAELRDITSVTDYREIFEGLDDQSAVVICGGDGTLNRFLNDSEGAERKGRLYFCPVGSGNDFARDLPKDIERGGVYEIDRYVKELPTVEVNRVKKRFINGVGYGIDGYCCEEGDRLKLKSAKKVNYTSIAIKGLLFGFKRRQAVITVDGTRYEYKNVWLAPTMNGRFYGGGMMPTPDQDRLSEDGRLSVLVFHGCGKLRTLMIFPSLFKGEHLKHRKFAEVLTGYDITVEYDRETALQIDGETVSGVKSYRAVSSRKN